MLLFVYTTARKGFVNFTADPLSLHTLMTSHWPFNNAPCTLHLSRSHSDRWGSTDLATLSLHLILFSASLRALHNFKPVHSEILLSQRFFCGPLLLPLCTVPYEIVLASTADLDTCLNHFNLHLFTMVKISSWGPMACLILYLTASLVMWSLYEMPNSFLKHLISAACNFFRISAVNAQVSQAYNNEITGERVSLIFELRDICFSFQMVFNLASAAVVCAILDSTSGLEP